MKEDSPIFKAAIMAQTMRVAGVSVQDQRELASDMQSLTAQFELLSIYTGWTSDTIDKFGIELEEVRRLIWEQHARRIAPLLFALLTVALIVLTILVGVGQ